MSNTRLTGNDLEIGDFVEAIFQGNQNREPKTVRASVEEITSDGVILLQPILAAPFHVQVDSPEWSYVLIEKAGDLTPEQQEEAESVFGPVDEVQLKHFLMTALSPQGQEVFCHHCGAANSATAAQCFACGSQLSASVPSGTGSNVVSTVSAVSTGIAGVTTTAYCDRCGEPNRSSALYCRKCGTAMSGPIAPASATGLLTTQNLLHGRYRILGQVGKGGFGAVYKAADTQFGNRPLAVKEMSQAGLDPAQVADAVKAFKREALLLAGLMNSHLPRIYDHFPEGGRWYLVMDFIEGETLEDYLNRALQAQQEIPVEEVLDIGQQVCDVLWYLHNRQPPIIFRDLKPANIMRTDDGHLFLIDFGIARHFKPGQAKDTAALGSTGYAPKEQYGRGQTTPRSDLYALGAILHQLLAGDDPSQTPFTFRPLGKTGRRFPKGLVELIAMLVEMDEDKRPESAQLVKKAFVCIAGGKGLLPELQAPGQAQATVTPAPPTEACQFFVPDHTGECTYRGKRQQAAGHLVDTLRRRVVYGEKVQAQLTAVEEALRQTPSLAEFITPDYLRCKGVRKRGYDYRARPDRQCTCDRYRPVSDPVGAAIIDDLVALAASPVPATQPAGGGVVPFMHAPPPPATKHREPKGLRSLEVSVSLISAPLFSEEEGRSYPDDEQLVEDLRQACAGIAARASAHGQHFVFRDKLEMGIGAKKREALEQYVTSATALLVLFTPSLLASQRACALVNMALDIKFDRLANNRDMLILPIIGIACKWQETFPELSSNRNRVVAPVDGKPLQGRPDLAKQLQKMGNDLGELLIPGV